MYYVPLHSHVSYELNGAVLTFEVIEWKKMTFGGGAMDA